jgi:hypothetical protein
MPVKMLLRRVDGTMRFNSAMERMIDYMIEGDPMETPQEAMDPCGRRLSTEGVRELLSEPAFIAAFEEKRRLFIATGNPA